MNWIVVITTIAPQESGAAIFSNNSLQPVRAKIAINVRGNQLPALSPGWTTKDGATLLLEKIRTQKNSGAGSSLKPLPLVYARISSALK